MKNSFGEAFAAETYVVAPNVWESVAPYSNKSGFVMSTLETVSPSRYWVNTVLNEV